MILKEKLSTEAKGEEIQTPTKPKAKPGYELHSGAPLCPRGCVFLQLVSSGSQAWPFRHCLQKHVQGGGTCQSVTALQKKTEV